MNTATPGRQGHGASGLGGARGAERDDPRAREHRRELQLLLLVPPSSCSADTCPARAFVSRPPGARAVGRIEATRTRLALGRVLALPGGRRGKRWRGFAG